MHVCTSLQTDNHASTPPLCFLQAGCPSCRPTNSVKALKAIPRCYSATIKIPLRLHVYILMTNFNGAVVHFSHVLLNDSSVGYNKFHTVLRRIKLASSVPDWGVVLWARDERSIDGLSKPESITPHVTAGFETSMSTVDWLLTGLVLCVDLNTQAVKYLDQSFIIVCNFALTFMSALRSVLYEVFKTIPFDIFSCKLSDLIFLAKTSP